LSGDSELDNGLREMDVRRVIGWLDNYHKQHSSYDASWRGYESPLRPAYFEIAFGPRRQIADEPQEIDDEADPVLSSLEPFKLDCGDETVLFSGRIDRIDVGVAAGQTVFNVVDYKSSATARITSKDVLEGRALQLP